MQGEMGEREKIVFSEMVTSWFSLRREFSKQVLSLSTLSTAGIYALGLKSVGPVSGWLIASGVLFAVCVACSLIEMYLDAKVIKFNLKGEEIKRPWLHGSVKGLSLVACLAFIAGAVSAGVYVVESKKGEGIMSEDKNRQGYHDGERDLTESKEILKDAQKNDSESSKGGDQKSD